MTTATKVVLFFDSAKPIRPFFSPEMPVRLVLFPSAKVVVDGGVAE